MSGRREPGGRRLSHRGSHVELLEDRRMLSLPPDLVPRPFSDVDQVTPVANGDVFFTSYGQLWKTDGTDRGTFNLSQGNPARRIPTNVTDVTAVGNWVYFSADDGVHGEELWRSDGTATGTVMVIDLRPGPDDSRPSALFEINGRLAFTAYDAVDGDGIWISDGTQQGTTRLADGRPDSVGTGHDAMANVGGTLYFNADKGLWKSGGTPETTTLVRQFENIPSVDINKLYSAHGQLFLDVRQGGARQLWRSDGTSEGTYVLTSQEAGSIAMLGSLGEVALFRRTAFDSSSSIWSTSIWKTDGTVTGTVPLESATGLATSSAAEFEGRVYFTGRDEAENQGLWVVEGADLQTRLVAGGSADPNRFESIGEITATSDQLYFAAYDQSHERALWSSDGTTAGTIQVHVFENTSISLTATDDAVLVKQNARFGDPFSQSQLWISDGTPSGTKLIRRLERQRLTVDFNWNAQVVDDKLYFISRSPFGETQLWSTDGTFENTVSAEMGQGFPFPANGQWFYSGLAAGLGNELFISNALGDAAVVVDIAPGEESSSPRGFVEVNGRVYFVADDTLHGEELWQTDGTVEGTILVRDLTPGTANSAIRDLANLDGKLVFSATTGGGSHRGMFVLDGLTQDLTKLTPDEVTYVHEIQQVGSIVFFAGDTEQHGRELWRTDGTVEGTFQVLDLYDGEKGAFPNILTEFQGKLVFRADDESTRNGLWVSDGTEAGTVLLRSGLFINPYVIGKTEGLLFFRASDGEHGYELWKSDGTIDGTQLVVDFTPGPASTNLGVSGSFDTTLFFTLDDGIHGYELWTTDGTAEGTKLIADTHPGPRHGILAGAIQYDGLMYFPAGPLDRQTLWKSDGTPEGTGPAFGPGTDTLALLDPSTSTFYFNDTHAPGPADTVLTFGPAASGWTPLAGDWHGDGIDTYAWYDPQSSIFFYRSVAAPGRADGIVQYGPSQSTLSPLAGDWNGSAVDSFALYDASTGTFFYSNSQSSGPADGHVQFGPGGANWIALAGDWNGDNRDTVGVYDPVSGTFFLRNEMAAGPADITVQFGPAGAGWQPLVGDWDSDGVDTVALYDPITSTLFFTNTHQPGPAAGSVSFGPANSQWVPLAGNWDGGTRLPQHAILAPTDLEEWATQVETNAATPLPTASVTPLLSVPEVDLAWSSEEPWHDSGLDEVVASLRQSFVRPTEAESPRASDDFAAWEAEFESLEREAR